MLYQVWYRIKPRRGVLKSSNRSFRRLVFEETALVCGEGKLIGENEFNFLHQEKKFADKVDWNFFGYGKLWNYHLQYFDYAVSNSVDIEVIQKLTDDFSFEYLKGNIKPEPYPISLRVVNWLLFYSLTGRMNEISRYALHAQIDFLRSNLEYHIDGNHLLENRIALTIISLYTDEYIGQDESFRLLKAELDKQILADGAHYERTPMYHCILTSRLLLLIALKEKNDIAISEDVYNAVRIITGRMLGWLKAFCFRDCSYAMFHDSAPGIAPEPMVLFSAAQDYGIDISAIDLKESGYRKFVQGDSELIIDIGEISPSHQPGHSHACVFNFCLQYKDRSLVIDSGITTYEPNAQRMFERSTLAHNTVSIDDKNQSEIWSSFRVGRRAKVKLLKDENYEVSAVHDGYAENGCGTIQRSFYMDGTTITITDSVNVKAGRATARLHFDAGVTERLDNDILVLTDSNCRISFKGADAIRLRSCKISNGYNRLSEGALAEIDFTNTLITEFLFT